MSELTRAFQDLPAEGLIPVGLLVIVGLMLWLAGTKILRFSFAAAGMVVGGCAGWMIGEIFNLGMLTWGAAVLGAALVAMVAILAFRTAVALGMAALLGIAAPLGALTIAEIQASRTGQPLSQTEFSNPVTDSIGRGVERIDQPELRQQVADTIKSMGDSLSQIGDQISGAAGGSLINPDVQQSLDEITRFSQRMIEAVKEKWQATPESLRPTLIIAAVAGVVIGFFLGMFATRFSAATITALGGSLLLLAGGQILAVRAGIPPEWLPHTGMAWLIVWLITSGLGLVIQWTLTKRRADKAR